MHQAFCFSQRHARIDWDAIHDCDVMSMQHNVDAGMLEHFLQSLVFARLGPEEL